MFFGLGLDRRDITTVSRYPDPDLASSHENRRRGSVQAVVAGVVLDSFWSWTETLLPPSKSKTFPSCSCVSSPSQFFRGCLSYRPLLIRSWHLTLRLSVICWAFQNAGSCLPHTLQGLRSRQKQFVDFFQSNQNKKSGVSLSLWDCRVVDHRIRRSTN